MGYKMFLPFFLMGLSLPALAQDGGTTATTAERREREIKPGGLFIEPIVSASREASTIKTGDLPLIADDTSGLTTGFGIGARLGVHINETLLVGADGRYSRVRFSDSFYGAANGDAYNYGPAVTLQTPLWGIRLMGAYVLGGQFDPGTGVNGMDLRFRNPQGPRLGAGLYFRAVSLNLEYEDLIYANTDIQSVGGVSTSAVTDVGYSNRGYSLSVSFPVEL